MKLLAVFALIASLHAAPSRGMDATTVASAAPDREIVQVSPAHAKRAQQLLAQRIDRYPLLKGTSVAFGSTPDGHQAVAYYTTGHILIDPGHTATLASIIDHEIWHIIDWRDNGRIDFEENVPPNNAKDYER